jgi:hypothetical protein
VDECWQHDEETATPQSQSNGDDETTKDEVGNEKLARFFVDYHGDWNAKAQSEKSPVMEQMPEARSLEATNSLNFLVCERNEDDWTVKQAEEEDANKEREERPEMMRISCWSVWSFQRTDEEILNGHDASRDGTTEPNHGSESLNCTVCDHPVGWTQDTKKNYAGLAGGPGRM